MRSMHGLYCKRAVSALQPLRGTMTRCVCLPILCMATSGPPVGLQVPNIGQWHGRPGQLPLCARSPTFAGGAALPLPSPPLPHQRPHSPVAPDAHVIHPSEVSHVLLVYLARA